MGRRFALGVLPLAVAVFFAANASATKAKPRPCAGGRYIVTGTALVTGDSAGPIEPVVIGNVISIGNACGPVHPKLRATKRGTMVSATWASCDGLRGKVKLKGMLDTTCTSLTGRLVAKKSKVAERFTARLTRCGDEVVDPANGEQCDGGTCPGGVECTAECTCPSVQSTTTTATTTTLPSSCAVLGRSTNCCGNGIVDPGEECDDGNSIPDDGCTDCKLDPVPCNADGLDARVCLVRTQETAPDILGIEVEVGYPPPLSIPGSGVGSAGSPIRQRVTDLTGAGGLSAVADLDRNADGIDETLRNAYVMYATTPPTPLPLGPFELIHFDCPAGTLVRAQDLHCAIPHASDPLGGAIEPAFLPPCLVGIAPHGGTSDVLCPTP